MHRSAIRSRRDGRGPRERRPSVPHPSPGRPREEASRSAERDATEVDDGYLVDAGERTRQVVSAGLDLATNLSLLPVLRVLCIQRASLSFMVYIGTFGYMDSETTSASHIWWYTLSQDESARKISFK